MSTSDHTNHSSMSAWLTLGSAMLTPAVVLQIMKDGNDRFVRGESAGHDVHEALRITATGQSPFAAIVSCIDSRVPVETVFDLTIGHAFSARVAGNVVNDDILGSLEFACAVAGSRLIVILGHTGCGAIKGACDHVELGNLTGLLNKIQPAVDAVKTDGDRTSKNVEFVDSVAEANVTYSMGSLMERSPVLRDLIDAGKVGLVGAMYDVRTGQVTFLEAPHAEATPDANVDVKTADEVLDAASDANAEPVSRKAARKASRDLETAR